MNTRLIVALLWIASLLGVAAVAHAQRVVRPGLEPEVIAGSDVGFRVNHYRGDAPVGELVVKRDGKWIAVEFDARVKTMR